MRVFKETQRFDQWWMKLINVVLFGFLVFCLYNWYVANQATGNVATTDTTGQIAVILSIVPVMLFLFLIKLETAISPIQEYGGWGYRTSFGKKKGSAYNVKGDKGIQIELKTGKKLLIGTQKEDEAQQVIGRYFNINDA